MDLELKKIKLLDEISLCRMSLDDKSIPLDDRIKIRQKLSLLLHKFEVINNRINNKFASPTNFSINLNYN